MYVALLIITKFPQAFARGNHYGLQCATDTVALKPVAESNSYATVCLSLKTCYAIFDRRRPNWFIANTYIGGIIRLIYDLISYLNKENMPGLLLCLDFEKAFDSVDWRFMFKVLHAFGFGPDISQWIFTFYRHIKSSVAVNVQLSEWFPIQRGCRQGDPISPYLFIL